MSSQLHFVFTNIYDVNTNYLFVNLYLPIYFKFVFTNIRVYK